MQLMSTMHEDFYAYLAKTSTQPLGLEVVHAQGMYLYDREGRAIMDLIAGISVSVLGHGAPKSARSYQNAGHALSARHGLWGMCAGASGDVGKSACAALAGAFFKGVFY